MKTVLIIFCLSVSFASNATINNDFLDAVSKNKIHEVKNLLGAGADVNSKNSDGKPAIVVAIESNSFDVIPLLAYYEVNINATDTQNKSALFTAVELHKPFDVIDVLCKLGANVNLTDYRGTPALFLALRYKNFEVFKRLISSGANIETEFGGKKIIHFASDKFGGVEFVKTLIESGADKNAKDWQGATPLIIAAYYGQLETVKYLLSIGVDLNQKAGLYNATALGYAKENGFNEIVEILIKAGAI